MAAPPVLDQLAALTEPTRARLLVALDRHELSVGELCSVVQLPQSTVSRHLRVLGEEGWVVSRPEGTSRRYAMAPLGASALRVWAVVREALAGSPEAVHDAERLRAVLAARRAGSRAYFEGAAAGWDATRTELFGRAADASALLALLDPTWTVGDLGCGTGATAAAVAPWVARVIAVDGSPAMLEAARSRLQGVANVELRAGELEALPVADRELDVALLFLVLHHVAEPALVLAEAARALRPGRTLLVVDMLPHDREEYRRTMGHVWLGFPEPQLAGWLREAGFAPPRVRTLTPDPDARGPVLFAAVTRRLPDADCRPPGTAPESPSRT